jgi:hypothetical protein
MPLSTCCRTHLGASQENRDANKAAALMDCYADPEYQAAAKLRHAIAEGWAVILEGYDGSQDIDGTMIRAALAAAAPSA